MHEKNLATGRPAVLDLIGNTPLVEVTRFDTGPCTLLLKLESNNPANPLAHETGTGPEIWAQSGHDVDAIVVGVGSSGTLTGLTRFFRKVAPAMGFVLADPVGSILAEVVKSGHVGTAGSWAVEGIGEDFIPSIADLGGVTHAYSISDEESFS